MGKDPYKILQVATHADPEVIEAAYRRLAQKYHPDVNKSALAETKMQDLNWAYEILRDPKKRAEYDRRSTLSVTPTYRTTEGPYRYKQDELKRDYQAPDRPSYKTSSYSQKSSMPESYCQVCGIPAQTKYVEFYQNIGAIFMRFRKEVKGNLCKTCIEECFWKWTGITLLLGWWGIISALLTPFILLNNIFRYLGAIGLQKPTMRQPSSSTTGWRLVVLACFGFLGFVGLNLVREMSSPVSNQEPSRASSSVGSPTQQECNYSDVMKWTDIATQRYSESTTDWDTWDEFSSVSLILVLKNNAQSRFDEAKNQPTPSCLRDLQDIDVKFYLTEVKFYTALLSGNDTAAANFVINLDELSEDFNNELERISQKYGWD
jgi:hypothetical protein